jgi:CRP-like cAMP-binding protein
MSKTLPLAANGLLARLSDREIRTVGPDLVPVSFSLGEVVFESHATLHQVYFPTSAVFSIIKVMKNGSPVETEAIGREGMAGVEAIFEADGVPGKMIAQIAGAAYCMAIPAFREHMRRRSRFRAMVLRYGQIALASLAQSVACNRLHNVNRRCAKWLLLTHDRVGSDEFPVTHEFLSMMLGANRPAVTMAASTLQNAGFITYTRGIVRILNRTGLEGCACECYAAMTENLRRLFPANHSQKGEF